MFFHRYTCLELAFPLISSIRVRVSDHLWNHRWFLAGNEMENETELELTFEVKIFYFPTRLITSLLNQLSVPQLIFYPIIKWHLI